MSIEFITPFLSATIEVLKTMAQTDAKPGKPTRREPQPAEGVVTSVVDFTGGTNGSVSITFTEDCIVGLANSMWGESFTEMNSEIEDAVGELINMISGVARKNLSEKGFIFQGGIPRVLKGEGHTIDHSVSGTVVAVPFKTKDGVFVLEACFESQEYLEDVQKAQADAVLKESNSSLVPVKLKSFFGPNVPEFKSFFLKPNSQIMKPSFFLVPEYVGPTEGNDSCNFTALEVSVCPKTFFASNNINFFKHVKNPSNVFLEDVALQKAILPTLLEIQDRGISIPTSMYSVGRSVENAILAYNLAIRTSEALYKHDSTRFAMELGKIGEYSLKAALLSKLIKSIDREREFLNSAHQYYRKSLPTVSGEEFFRRCFRLVALSVYLENYTAAKEETSLLIKYFQTNSSKIKQDEAPRIKKYIKWVGDIYNAKEAFSITKHQDRDNFRFFEFN